MIASGINLVMTVIGFAVSTMFILFVCTRLICARIQQSASRRRAFPAAARTYHFSILERRNGLEPFVVANFPTKSFSDKLFSFEEDTQCTICLSEYQENDKLRMLPYCGHAFHVTCIDIWLRQHSTCPVCRVSLHESPERKRIMNPQYSQPVRCPRSPRLFNSQSSHHQLCADHHRLPLRPLEVIGTELIHQDHIEASNTGDSTVCTSALSDAKEAACFPGPEQNQVESH